MSSSSKIKTRKKVNHPIDAHIGFKIRKLRKELGISQGKVAEVLNVTFQQVQKYENGQNRINCSKLYDISSYFKVSPTYFFNGFERSSLEEKINEATAYNVKGIMLLSETKVEKNANSQKSRKRKSCEIIKGER